MKRQVCAELIRAGNRLANKAEDLRFSTPVTHVYNPLSYAWASYEQYLRRFANSPKRVVFLGMNPGPFGMVQTGVPFGEVRAVKGWLKIEGDVGRPSREHPARPILGFACPRCEVSGERLWGLFALRYGAAEEFFSEHMVLNYCPLAFLEESGRNRTPDKLPKAEKLRLFAACDEHLRAAVEALEPEWVVGIGDFATQRAGEVLGSTQLNVARILHPSPASPAANRDWAGAATRQLKALRVW